MRGSLLIVSVTPLQQGQSRTECGLRACQKLLGRGSLQLTMDLYCHVTDDPLFDEMRKMEAV